MTLPPDFVFNQRKIQDFLDCPRRFFLRYIEKVHWPAPVSEPLGELEQAIRDGAFFHNLIRQFLTGISTENLDSYIQSDEIRTWWRNFQTYVHPVLSEHCDSSKEVYCAPEVMLTSVIGGFRVVAKYDFLIVRRSEKSQIWDWKTSKRLHKLEYLQQRTQSRLYPLVLALEGYHLKPPPDSVEMIYWNSNHPNTWINFDYDQRKFTRDLEFFETVIRTISLSSTQDFIMTEESNKCKFCVFRSYCDRGRRAGEFNPAEIELEDDDMSIDIDFEQISEIEF